MLDVKQTPVGEGYLVRSVRDAAINVWTTKLLDPHDTQVGISYCDETDNGMELSHQRAINYGKIVVKARQQKLNVLQQKLLQAAQLLVEAGALAASNATLYNDDPDKSKRRRFHQVCYDLQPHHGVTIEGLVNMASTINHLPLLTDELDQERITKDMNWIMRDNKELKERM
jgi:hypothetical protein